MTCGDGLDPVELIRQLTSEDSESIRAAARAIAEHRVLEAVPAMLEVLDSSNDPNVWNPVAIALGDMRIQEAKEHIVALVKNPKTMKSRGSLLYALQQGLDYRDESPMLTEMCISGNYEVRGEAATALVAIASSLSGELRNEVALKLRHSAEFGSGELSEFFCAVLDDFEAAAARAEPETSP